MSLQKKDIIFCDGEVFSLDRGLLMGAINTSSSISISSTYIVFVIKLQKKQTQWNGFALIGIRYHMFFFGQDTCVLIAASAIEAI
jgi:hypothetical protein